MTKNNLLFALTIFFVAGSAWAQSYGPIADGGMVRLDPASIIRTKYKNQDQDGLGTCFANTASLMLQSRLGGNPEVSYLNLAFMMAEKVQAPLVRVNGKDSSYRNKKTPTAPDEFLFEGSFACEVIMIAKERGGVCKRSDVALEHFVSQPSKDIANVPYLQKELMVGLSKYYDGIFKDFGRPEKNAHTSPAALKFNDYKNALKSLLSKRMEAFNTESCLAPDITNAEKVTKNLLLKIDQQINVPAKKTISTIRTLLSTKDAMGAVHKNTTAEEIKIEAAVSDKFKEVLKDVYVNELKNGPDATPEKVFMKAVRKISPDFSEEIFAQIGGFSPEDLSLLSKDHNYYVKKDLGNCLEKRKLDYFIKKEGLLHDFLTTPCLSRYKDHAINIKELVTTLDKVNLKNMDSLYKYLMDLPSMNYEEAMMKVIAPDCPDHKKIKLPENLACEAIDIHYTQEGRNGEDDEFIEATKLKLRTIAIDAMARGHVVGMSMCTGFYDPALSNQFYNKTKTCPNIKHGFHAVGMLGYRCRGGKMEYLVQNSWGDWAQARDRFPDTEPGRAWISEEDLAKNTYRLDIIK